VRIRYLLSCLIILSGSVVASTPIDLSANWFLKVDPAKVGEQQAWFRMLPADLEPVDLPHTWNVGRHSDFIGTAWYFKTFSEPATATGQHIELHFGATFYKARVWLNGSLVGEHEGGYSSYFFDITRYLKSSNFLAVEIDNEPKVDTIPGADLKASPNGTIYDWWPYGGIVRGAWLATCGDVALRWQHIDSHQKETGADISDRILLHNYASQKRALKVEAAIFDKNSIIPVATGETQVSAKPGDTTTQISTHLNSVRMWDFDNPFLYRSIVTISDEKGRVLDSRSDNFGIREVVIRDRHLYLNGQRVRLTGLARHESSPWEGLAETRGTMLHDYDDLKSLQTTLTRPVHYQQNPFIYDYADRKGILMIPEIPMWQFDEMQMKNPRVIALAKQLLFEMIDQNYNHPSIFAWSMDNESATNTPGGNAYFKTMYEYSKQLDPDRYVTFADDMIAFVDPQTNASRLADFIMWNEYFGSWDGNESLLPGAIDKIAKGYPNKMVLVSEFGYPGIFATDERTADEARVQVIRKHLALFAQQDWIAGAILWCYQDYESSHNLRPGQSDNYVDHGVVDKNRQRRPSYYVWQQQNAPAHISLNWTYDAKGVPSGFSAIISRRSEQEIPSYPLVNYRLRWRVLGEKGAVLSQKDVALAEMGPAQSVNAQLGDIKSSALRLELTLIRRTGFVAQTSVLTWHEPREGGLKPADVGAEFSPQY
jgi:beta-glucuronidase